MSLFDQTWSYTGGDQLSRVGNPNLLVPCDKGLVRRSPAGAPGPDDIDRVMDELGFSRLTTLSSPSCLVYGDRQNRRLDDQIRFGFGFPPVGLHWQVIRKQVDIWFAGPENDPTNIEYPDGSRR